MSRRYQYRVVLSSGASQGNPDWSEKDALAFARFAIKAGSRGACVERAVKYPGARRGEFTRVRCVRKR
jgi:hypothetical protein